MTDPHNGKLGFYLTPRHDCSYLPARMARTVFADPQVRPDMQTQTTLAAHGFRRSGRYLYRPSCPDCQACIPARIPVCDFTPSRTQRRTWKRNADLTIGAVSTAFRVEHFALYNRYQHARHPDGGMAASGADQYLEFLASPWSDTRFYEFRRAGELLAVAVVDRLADALSAIYTFFEPAETRRGLGTFAILWQIEEARRLGLGWVYLGYWIRESAKMRYKAHFRPLEVFRQGKWHRLEHPKEITPAAAVPFQASVESN